MSTEGSGTCRYCSQTAIIAVEDRDKYPDMQADDIATMQCGCEEGKQYREAKRQETVNMEFISFAENELLAFMRAHDLKMIKVVDDNGNSASLLRMEKGDTKIMTGLKKVVS